jgi:uncharacterized membrane protein YadS
MYYSSDEYSSSDDYESIVNPPCWKLKRTLNKEDLWAVYIGLMYFSANMGMAFWGVQAPKFYVWSTPIWGSENATALNMPAIGFNSTVEIGSTFTSSNVIGMLLLALSMIVAMSIVHKFVGRQDRTIYYLGMLACVGIFKMLSVNAVLYRIGVGEPAMCLIFGIFAGWVTRRRHANTSPVDFVHPKFFIKVALVLLAADLGYLRDSSSWKLMIVAWCETIITFFVVLSAGVFVLQIFGQTALVVASGVAVCGPPAAVTTSEVVIANKYATENLIAMMSVFTIPLIPTMYLLAARFDPAIPDIPDLVVGSWIGGSVDTAGGVVAAASMLSVAALRAAVAVKMLQTLFLGPLTIVATAVWYRTLRPGVLWERFPKAILGYILVVIIATFMPIGPKQLLIDNCFVFSEWFTALSFVAIGMSIDVTKPARFDIKVFILYMFGQTFDLASTLGVAYLLFKN